jgi:hypothetical protein
MATSNPSAALNAEPSRPDERESQDLKPKSYVDAVRGDPGEAAKEIVNGTSTPNGINGTDVASQDQHTNSSTRGSWQGASVLRIVETQDNTVKTPGGSDSNGDTTKGAGQIHLEERPGIERQELKHEYSANVRTRWISTNAMLCANTSLGP